jgi:hypothetical protein
VKVNKEANEIIEQTDNETLSVQKDFPDDSQELPIILDDYTLKVIPPIILEETQETNENNNEKLNEEGTSKEITNEEVVDEKKVADETITEDTINQIEQTQEVITE